MSLRRFGEAEPPRVELARAGSAIAVCRAIAPHTIACHAIGADGEEFGPLSPRGLAGWAPRWDDYELEPLIGMEADDDAVQLCRVADGREVASFRPDERLRLIRDTLGIAGAEGTLVRSLTSDRARTFEAGSELVDAAYGGTLVLLSTRAGWECWRLETSARAPIARGPERAVALGARGEAVIVRDADDAWIAISLTGTTRRTLAPQDAHLRSVHLGASGVLIVVLDRDVAWWDEERAQWERVGVVERATDLHVHPLLPMATWTSSDASGPRAVWWSGGRPVSIASGRAAGFVSPRELDRVRARRQSTPRTTARVRFGTQLPSAIVHSAWRASLWPRVRNDASSTAAAARAGCRRHEAAWSDYEHSQDWDFYPREELERSSLAALIAERTMLAAVSDEVVQALLGDDDPRVRRVAGQLSIVRGGDVAMQELLVSADAAHRRVALGALEGRSREEVADILERAFGRAATWEIQAQLLEPLRALLWPAEGDALVRRELPRLLAQRSGLDDFRERERMWQVLVEVDPPLARETLAKIGEKNPDVRRRVRSLLARRGPT